MQNSAWHTLRHFRFALFSLNIRALDFFPLPLYWESDFRNSLRSSFKVLICSSQGTGCGDCGDKGDCPYLYCFETPLPPGQAERIKYSPAPHPFIISPPLDRARSYNLGEIITFDIVLIGGCIQHLGYFVSVFERMGLQGLGRENSRFRIESISAKMDFRKEKTIYEPGYEKVSTDFKTFSGEDLAGLPSPAGKDELAIEFLTPFLTKSNPKSGANLFFYVFATNLLTRLDMLHYFQYGRLPDFDSKGLISRSHFVKTKESNLSWINPEPYSKPQSRPYSKGGFVGSIEYHGSLEEFLPCVALGQFLHAGREATYGFGRYRIIGRPD